MDHRFGDRGAASRPIAVHHIPTRHRGQLGLGGLYRLSAWQHGGASGLGLLGPAVPSQAGPWLFRHGHSGVWVCEPWHSDTVTLRASLQWQKPAPELTAQVSAALEAGDLSTIRALTPRRLI